MIRRAISLVACLLLCGNVFAAEQFAAGELTGERAGVWLDVPFVKQSKNACGAASIAMVMEYWQLQQGGEAGVDAEQIQRALYSSAAHGIYSADLEHYLRQQRFSTFAFQGNWDDIREHLEKGRPLIVALKSGGDALHYVVVTGLDWQQGLLLKNDPAERKLLKQDRASFEKEWKAAGNWTLLAVPQPDGQVSSGSR